MTNKEIKPKQARQDEKPSLLKKMIGIWKYNLTELLFWVFLKKVLIKFIIWGFMMTGFNETQLYIHILEWLDFLSA